jgi:hypothetical protein
VVVRLSGAQEPALRNGTLKINGAVKLCKFSKAEQLEKFIRQSEDREIGKVIRKSIRSPRKEKINPDVVTTLEALLQQEVVRPGSVEILVSDSPRTVIVVTHDSANPRRQFGTQRRVLVPFL